MDVDPKLVPATDKAKDLSAAARKPLERSNIAIEKLKSNLAKAPKQNKAELLASLEEAQSAIREVTTQQELVEQQLDIVFTLGKELQQQTAKLEEEKKALQADKTSLERREIVWSTTVIAAVLTALVALASAILKWPMMRLEMQLKRLEISERELKLQGQKQATTLPQEADIVVK